MSLILPWSHSFYVMYDSYDFCFLKSFVYKLTHSGSFVHHLRLMHCLVTILDENSSMLFQYWRRSIAFGNGCKWTVVRFMLSQQITANWIEIGAYAEEEEEDCDLPCVGRLLRNINATIGHRCPKRTSVVFPGDVLHGLPVKTESQSL